MKQWYTLYVSIFLSNNDLIWLKKIHAMTAQLLWHVEIYDLIDVIISIKNYSKGNIHKITQTELQVPIEGHCFTSEYQLSAKNQFKKMWSWMRKYKYIFTTSILLCLKGNTLTLLLFNIFKYPIIIRAYSRFAPSQWETALLCNDVSHWLGANLESALHN